MKEVIGKARHPVTKAMLTRKFGRRLIELEDGSQVRLEKLLKAVASMVFRNANEVMSQIKL